MASKGKKSRAKWDSEVERKLIDIWADIIGEFDGKLITRRKKEAIATTHVLLLEALLSRCSPESTWSLKGANYVLKRRQNQQTTKKGIETVICGS